MVGGRELEAFWDAELVPLLLPAEAILLLLNANLCELALSHGLNALPKTPGQAMSPRLNLTAVPTSIGVWSKKYSL